MPFSLHALCFYISFPPNSPAPATYPLFLLHTYTYCDSHLLTLIIFSISSDLDCIISYLIISSHLKHFSSLLFFSCIYNVIYLLNFRSIVFPSLPPPTPLYLESHAFPTHNTFLSARRLELLAEEKK